MLVIVEVRVEVPHEEVLYALGEVPPNHPVPALREEAWICWKKDLRGTFACVDIVAQMHDEECFGGYRLVYGWEERI